MSRRHRPLYPALLAGALALGASGCGPLEDELARFQQLQQQATRADGGSPTPAPQPPDFIGGDAAWVLLPDGGLEQ